MGETWTPFPEIHCCACAGAANFAALNILATIATGIAAIILTIISLSK